MKIISRKDEQRADGREKEITFAEYLATRRKLALELRAQEKKRQLEAKSTLKKKE